MLKELLESEIRNRGLNIRIASEQIGVSHTTVLRTLRGEPLDMPTLVKFCSWLGVEPTLAMVGLDESNAVSTFDTITQVVPGLLEILEKATEDFKKGDLSPEDLEEIASFIAFKLNARKAANEVKPKSKITG